MGFVSAGDARRAADRGHGGSGPRFRPLRDDRLLELARRQRHGAHALNAHTLLEAVPAAADPSQYAASAQRYGVWDVPKLYLHLYGEDPTMLNYETPLEAFGGQTAMEVALAAYAEHLSQQVWTFTVYDYDSPVDSHRFGLARSLVGADEAKDDLMEHIDPGDWRSGE